MHNLARPRHGPLVNVAWRLDPLTQLFWRQPLRTLEP